MSPKASWTKSSTKAPKYIFVSGGVLSGLGKGITTASLSLLLKSRGYRVGVVKCENYLNIDSGLINPIEHGDPFLCEDGTETDMDLGTYERFLNQNMSQANFVTMGQIYQAVINRERSFGYKGEDVEMPHICDEIIRRINLAGLEVKADIIIAELGGTAGEYLNVLYYETSRILQYRSHQTVLHVHVSYLPTPPHIGEPKTKPTQLSVQRLNSMGIQPNFIVARSREPLDERRRDRFALFCNVRPGHIITNPDMSSIYQVPELFASQKFDIKVLSLLNLPAKKLRLSTWKAMTKKLELPKKTPVTIAIIGKYLATGNYELKDSYAALYEALVHAATFHQLDLRINWINSQVFEKSTPKQITKKLKNISGVIVPIGWGARGVEGKIKAIRFARENKIPFLGLCYGMQLAVVEYARHVLGLTKAHTTEVKPKTPHPVIHIIPEQKRNLKDRAYGGTMRLGAWDCVVKKDTLAWKAYSAHRQFKDKKRSLTSERHRHRYEFNNKYAKRLEKAGLIISGRSVKENLVELIELPQSEHPFFMGTQGHPEYKSRPLTPHALFLDFLKACKSN